MMAKLQMTLDKDYGRVIVVKVFLYQFPTLFHTVDEQNTTSAFQQRDYFHLR